MIGGSSLFHNIQPREELSPGGRRVYKQQKTSPEQIQRWWSEDPLSFTTSSQEKNVLQETDVSTIKRRLHQSKHRGDDRRILSLSQHPAKRRTLSRRQTCLQSREDFTRANTEVMIRGSSLFHNIQPREEHSPGGRHVYNQEKTSPEQTQRWWSEDPLSFTTSSQEKNTLQETDVSTSKRRPHQSKYRGDDRRILSLSQHPAKRRTLSRRQTCLQAREDLTRANTELYNQVQSKQGQITLWQKTSKKPEHFWKSIVWTAEIKIHLYQNDGKIKVWRRLGTARDQSIQHPLWSTVEQCDAWAAWLPVALGCLVMMWQKDRNSRMNSEVYRVILSAQIQSKSAKLIVWRFIVQMDNDPKHTGEATQEFLKVKKWIILQWSSHFPGLNPIELHFTRWRQN